MVLGNNTNEKRNVTHRCAVHTSVLSSHFGQMLHRATADSRYLLCSHVVQGRWSGRGKAVPAQPGFYLNCKRMQIHEVLYNDIMGQ